MMFSQKLVVSLLLTALVVLGGLSACRKDEPETNTSPPPKESPTKEPPQAQPQKAKAATEPAHTQPREASPTKERTRPVKTLRGEPGRNQAPVPPQKRSPISGAFQFRTPERDAADAAARELVAQWNKIHSVTAKIRVEFEQEGDPQQKAVGEGTYDCMKKDGKILIREKKTSSIAFEKNEEEGWLLTGRRLLTVFDGEFLYTLTKLHSGTTATKTRPRLREVPTIGGRPLFNKLGHLSRLRRLGNTMVVDKIVYVFEGTSSNGDVTTWHYIDRDTGIRVKGVRKDKSLKSKYTITLSDIELDPEFPEDHFTFTPPEGVVLEDLTQPKPREVGPPAPGP